MDPSRTDADPTDPDAVERLIATAVDGANPAAAHADDTRREVARLARLLEDQQVQTRTLLGHLRHLRQVLPRVDELARSLRDTPLPTSVGIAAMDLLLAVEDFDEAARHSRLAAIDPSWDRIVGSARTCACCGERTSAARDDRRCAVCDASRSDRLLWAWVVSRTGLSRSRSRVLHLGASPAIRTALGRCPDVRLVPADRAEERSVFLPPGWTLPVGDGVLDLVLCDAPPWDVLANEEAIAELRRGLHPRGALAFVLDGGDERGPDRKRIAGLRAAGLTVNVEALPGYAGGPLSRRCGFDPDGAVLAVRRSDAP